MKKAQNSQHAKPYHHDGTKHSTNLTGTKLLSKKEKCQYGNHNNNNGIIRHICKCRQLF